MTKCRPIYWFFALLASCLLVACSNQPQGTATTEIDEVSQQLGTVEKVSVLSTDGSELPLNLGDFDREIVEQAAQLERTDAALSPDQVKFTLVVHRGDLAPLVIEVGSKASQVGEIVYSGPAAEAFYQWAREKIGLSLFQHKGVYAIQLTAADQNRSYTLSQEESIFVWQTLQAATYQEKWEPFVYPLYPAYQLKLDLGERVLDVAVLTPGLLSVRFGNEVLYYRMAGDLFSKLTEWLPPHGQSPDSFDPLFHALKVRITVPDPNGSAQTWVIGESIEEQGRVHHLVRLLKQAVPIQEKLTLPEKPWYTLEFVLPDGMKRIQLFDKWFTFEDKIYEHTVNIDNIPHFLAKAANGAGK